MKLSDGFDARRLRPRGPRNWGTRLGQAFAAVLAALGVLLALAGAASLFGHPPALGDLNASKTGASLLVVFGLVVLYLGVGLWRRCRRRRQHNRALNLAPHLMKKHD
ncbi:hypothetical protein LZ023_12805 [Pseudomonas silvicola]|uniref:hypothetical protein n=1 Tax=Pseudomonas sp. RIT-To-2 TaxID=3462541 RepID=UPI00227D5EA2|nr:hypothetical protein LZ023_12805 [Pseudomonas silvicola]